jgi:hypothetical protein
MLPGKSLGQRGRSAAKDQDLCAQNVPHELREIHFYSKAQLRASRFCLYSSGYDQNRRRYPVLYLQHGWGETNTAGVRLRSLIMDNLAEGKASPLSSCDLRHDQ